MFGAAVQQVSKVTSKAAPVKGLNAFDSLVTMPEGFAVIMRNMFPQPYGCQVRHGFVRHAMGLGGNVETLASHNKPAGNTLYGFVAIGTACNICDITVPNQVNPTPVRIVPNANARWETINFANSAGVSLVAVNTGGANPIWFKPDGTNMDLVAGNGSTAGTIANVDPKLFAHVYSHQKRLWFVERNSTRGWYLPPEALYGVATAFDFGALWTRGGYLNQIITWTLDDGDGADDHLVAISSEGQVAVFAGTDPSNAATWSLKGVYFSGAPVGRRAATRYGGDIVMLTQFGIVLLSNLLKSTKVNAVEAEYGKYVQQLLSAAITARGTLFGWQPFIFPGANMVIINIPAADNTCFQFVMNDITQAWAEFIGYNALCWCLHNEVPFFGGNGRVDRAWERYTDGAIVANDGTVTEGADIQSEAQTIFNYFDTPGLQKHAKMVSPSIICNGTFSIQLAVDVDFNFKAVNAPASIPPKLGGIWDNGKWDDAQWGYGLTAYRRWVSVEALGVAMSLRMRMRSNVETYWAATDWLIESGGVL